MGGIFPCPTRKKADEASQSLIQDQAAIDEEANNYEEFDLTPATRKTITSVPVLNENEKLKKQKSNGRNITVDDFVFHKVLGKGAFGKVLLVQKKDSGNLYAMKILKKDFLARRNQKLYTKAERAILENLNSPFIVQLHYAFQTPEKLYLVMDFMNGGELFFHLRREKKFDEARARFYAAEIILALEYIHSKGIIYRDLKPENLLLDAEGHIRLTDFGLSKQGVSGGKKAFTLCGTPEYLAPEIFTGDGHDKAADYWSLGALLYQMLAGVSPFYSKNQDEMFSNILKKPVQMQPHFSTEACLLLSELLVVEPRKRLSDPNLIKRHDFFRTIDWVKLSKKELRPPFNPQLMNSKDLKYFDRLFTEQSLGETPATSYLRSQNTDTYQGFTYQAVTYNISNSQIIEEENNSNKTQSSKDFSE